MEVKTAADDDEKPQWTGENIHHIVKTIILTYDTYIQEPPKLWL